MNVVASSTAMEMTGIEATQAVAHHRPPRDSTRIARTAERERHDIQAALRVQRVSEAVD